MAELPAPPAAPRRPQVLSAHGDERQDDWYWLRDRHDPAVIAYLEAENAYTEARTAHLRPLQERLFEEVKGRIQETDESAAVRSGGHWYSQRTVEGRQYAIHVRRSPDRDSPEEVLLDENELASGHEHFSLRALVPSHSHELAAYAVNFDGSDDVELRFRDLRRRRDLDDTIPGVTPMVAWAADDRTVFYVARDPALRPHQLWRYRLGEPGSAELVHEEVDERFRLSVDLSLSRQYVVMSIDSVITSEVWFLRADDPGGRFTCVEPRVEGRRYTIAHHGDRFLVVTDADGAVNSKLMEAPVGSPGYSSWREVLAHADDVRLHGVVALRDWIVLAERAGGVRRLRAMSAHDGRLVVVPQPEEVSTAVPGPNREQDTSVVRFQYTSLTTPVTAVDLDLDTGERTVVKQDEVLGGYDPDRFVTERRWATAPDGTRVPISLVRMAGVGEDGPAPCLLYGYGSYEFSTDPVFSHARLSLLERGVIFAIAHVRGGGELGRRWYEQGKLLAKPTTFTDFIACAEQLVADGLTRPEQLAAMGGSAGGLLMGAVVNMRPDLFRAVMAAVPFVDVVTTMLDESIPLTVPEFEEWGNPKDPAFYEVMKSYSPYDNVRAQAYPAMLVTTGLNDTRVAFWEPAKWVAKLRATKTDDRDLLLKTELGAGHAGPSGRYNAWRERAFEHAFLLDQLGLRDT